MRLHPELETYRDRLVERAGAWPDTPEVDLRRDLAQCEAQTALLEKGIDALRARLESGPATESEVLAHRVSVQEQMRDLTAAYAEVLRRHVEKLPAKA